MAKFQLQTHLKAIICPAAEFHYTRLFVEWKVLDIDFAGAFINRRWPPLDAPRVVQSGLCGQRHFEIAIGAMVYKVAVWWCCGTKGEGGERLERKNVENKYLEAVAVSYCQKLIWRFERGTKVLYIYMYDCV